MESRSVTQRLRQHHAIEHATITLLSRRVPGTRLLAHSDLDGFIVVGEIEAATLHVVAEEALAHLQRGESGLAVHPNCGTNLVTAGTLTGIGALLMTHGRDRSWVDRACSAILGATLALIIAAPAGRWMQANVTTSADVAGLCIASVRKLIDGPVVRHRVTIRSKPAKLAAQ